ncbi:MAG: hypothetical protein V7K35_25830 [Nostoc sp.]
MTASSRVKSQALLNQYIKSLRGNRFGGQLYKNDTCVTPKAKELTTRSKDFLL